MQTPFWSACDLDPLSSFSNPAKKFKFEKNNEYPWQATMLSSIKFRMFPIHERVAEETTVTL